MSEEQAEFIQEFLHLVNLQGHLINLHPMCMPLGVNIRIHLLHVNDSSLMLNSFLYQRVVNHISVAQLVHNTLCKGAVKEEPLMTNVGAS